MALVPSGIGKPRQLGTPATPGHACKSEDLPVGFAQTARSGIALFAPFLTREALMKCLFLFLLTALSVTAADLSGRVLDPSGAPVANARVTLTGRENGVRLTSVTKQSGEYRLFSIRAGSWIIEGQAEGFGASEAQSLEVTDITTADIRPTIARITTQVQVTAAAVAQTVDEQSKALDIVDSAQIERRAEFSVAEAIRTLPGVRVHQLGGPGAFTRVAIRGMRSTDTSFLIDGFRLRDVHQ